MPLKLLILDRNRNLRDFINFELIINTIAKKLYFKFEKTDRKKIAISFKRNLIFTKNLLCIPNSSTDPNYYVLILQSEETCKEVFDTVKKPKEDIDAHRRYRYREHIRKLVRNANVKIKIVGGVYQVVVDEKNNLVLRGNQKRNFAAVDSDVEGSDGSTFPRPKRSKKEYFQMKRIYEAPFFKTAMAERKGSYKKRLLIFPNEDKSYHFEFCWNNSIQCYCCCECGIKANILNHEDGTEYVKLKSILKHACSLRKYEPAKYTVDVETRIVQKENYKEIKYTQKGITMSKLFVFDPTNKQLCRGFYWENDNKYYLCMGCNAKSQRIFAKVCKNMDGDEYLMLSKNKHVCDLMEFKEEKYKDDVIVRKPLFEEIEYTVTGMKRKCLLIFTDESRKFCYKFKYDKGYLPICSKCSDQNLYIQAYILKDENGDDYVSIRNKKHLCKPVEYDPGEFVENQIIHPPRYRLIERYWRGRFVEKLVIFDPSDSSLCYELTKQQAKNAKCYLCNECHHKHNISVRAWIVNSEQENEHVELSKTQHKCQSIKFEDPDLSKVFSPNFKVIKTVKKGSSGTTKDHLLIYPSSSTADSRKLCYRLSWDVSAKRFECFECNNKKKIVSAKIFKNKKNEDFVQLGDNQHICEPQPEKAVLQRLSRCWNIQK